MKTIYKLQTS